MSLLLMEIALPLMRVIIGKLLVILRRTIDTGVENVKVGWFSDILHLNMEMNKCNLLKYHFRH